MSCVLPEIAQDRFVVLEIMGNETYKSIKIISWLPKFSQMSIKCLFSIFKKNKSWRHRSYSANPLVLCKIQWSSITYCKLYKLTGVSEKSAQIFKPTSHRCPWNILPSSKLLSMHCLTLNLSQYYAMTSIGSRPLTVQSRTLSAGICGSIVQYTKTVSRAIFNRRF